MNRLYFFGIDPTKHDRNKTHAIGVPLDGGRCFDQIVRDVLNATI